MILFLAPKQRLITALITGSALVLAPLAMHETVIERYADMIPASWGDVISAREGEDDQGRYTVWFTLANGWVIPVCCQPRPPGERQNSQPPWWRDRKRLLKKVLGTPGLA